MKLNRASSQRDKILGNQKLIVSNPRKNFYLNIYLYCFFKITIIKRRFPLILKANFKISKTDVRIFGKFSTRRWYFESLSSSGVNELLPFVCWFHWLISRVNVILVVACWIFLPELSSDSLYIVLGTPYHLSHD